MGKMRTKCEVWSRPKDEKGRFVPFSGKQRYKQCQVNGVRKQKHVAIWEKYHNKSVPDGCVIHHIDYNKFNNNINNLKCMTIKAHNILHHKDRKPWNKGKTTHGGNNAFGHSVSIKTIQKKKVGIFNKYLESFIAIWELKDEGLTPTQISIKLNISIDKVNHRWKSFNKGYLSWAIVGGI